MPRIQTGALFDSPCSVDAVERSGQSAQSGSATEADICKNYMVEPLNSALVLHIPFQLPGPRQKAKQFPL